MPDVNFEATSVTRMHFLFHDSAAQLQEHLASELYWVPVSGSAGYWEAGCSSSKLLLAREFPKIGIYDIMLCGKVFRETLGQRLVRLN